MSTIVIQFNMIKFEIVYFDKVKKTPHLKRMAALYLRLGARWAMSHIDAD